MVDDRIMECFRQAVDGGSGRSWNSKEKTDRQVHQDALIRVKNTETVLEYLCDAGFEDMTIQELYNEISGQAHLG